MVEMNGDFNPLFDERVDESAGDVGRGLEEIGVPLLKTSRSC